MRARHPVLVAVSRHTILAITGMVTALPFLWMVNLSLRGPDEIFDPHAGLLPQNWAVIDNYLQAVTAVPLLRFLANGVFICVAIAILQVALCAPIAFALAKHKFRGRAQLFALVLACLVIPQHALAIPLFVMARWTGILNSYAVLILPYAVTPSGIFLLRQAFLRVPDDVIHAARLDGLSESAIVWRVMVPMAAPAVTAFVLLAAALHWNELFWPLIAVRSQDLMPPALGVVAFRDDQAGSQYGVLMAAATLVVAPVIIVFLWAQRFFMDAIGAGAVK